MIMSQSLIAKQYATAYVNVYFDRLTLLEIESMQRLVYFLKYNQKAVGLIEMQSYQALDKQRFIVLLLEHCKILQIVEKLLDLLHKEKKMDYLVDILQSVCSIYKRRKNIIDLEIKTPCLLDDKQIIAIEKFFENHSGQKVVSSVVIDKSLLLGLRLQSDSYLWQNSVSANLARLKRKLLFEG